MSNTASVFNSEKCFSITLLCPVGVFPSICRQVNLSSARADAARSKVDFQNENTTLDIGQLICNYLIAMYILTFSLLVFELSNHRQGL